jgi:hypothetical protein
MQMTETAPCRSWWIAVSGKTVGPVPTDTILRGIETGRIPREAFVCEVGASEWSLLTVVDEFVSALSRCPAAPTNDYVSSTQAGCSSGEVAVADNQQPSEELSTGDDTHAAPYGQGDAGECSAARVRQLWPDSHNSRSAAKDTAADEVSYAGPIGQAALSDSHPATDDSDEFGIDIVFEETSSESRSDIDWSRRFHSYFLVGQNVELPAEHELLSSLDTTPVEAFRCDEGLWNLSLCLAFGSDRVSQAAAEAFFARVVPVAGSERLAWICRTLQSTGFMPSGIPRLAGNRGVEQLRRCCPTDLVATMEREVAS